jgi:Family of unknown function (DUF6152)
MIRRSRYPLAVLCAVVAAGALAPPARAHHSHGNYVETFTDIEGVVKEVHLVNPHSWIYIEVKGPDGRMLRWSLEASSRNALERIGVTHEYIKAGDTIKVRCHPLRDGSRGCLLGFVKARDGSVKDFDASNVPLPSDF